MKTKFNNFKDMIFGRVPNIYQDRFAFEKTETNISHMMFLSIYIIVIQIVLNVINILKPEDTKDTNIMVFVFLSLLALSVGVIYLILSILCVRNKIKNRKIRTFLPYSLLYIYMQLFK